MSIKKLNFLGVIAVIALVLAYVTSHVGRPEPAGVSGDAAMIQGLDPGTIAKIVLGSGDDASTLKRDGDRFIAADKSGYPCANSKINKLITDVLDIKAGELFTSNAENHGDLGVTEEDADHIIQFKNAQDDLLAGIMIGKRAEGVRGTYVRRMPGDDVYLSENTPYLQKRSLDYMDKKIFDLGNKKVIRVDVNGPDESYTILAGNAGGDPVLQDIPDGATAKSTDVKNVFQALSSMDLSDVRRDNAGLTFDRAYVCEMEDSTVYTLKIAKDGDKTYLTCSARFTDTTPITIDTRGQDSEEELDKKEAKALARRDAEMFSERHNGWIYEVASWQAGKVTKPLADLIEVPEPEEEEAEEAAEAAAPAAPVAPTEPVEPAAPVAPTEPVEPAAPAAPAEPVEPAAPAAPPAPVAPAAP